MNKRKTGIFFLVLLLVACLIFFFKPLLYHFHSKKNLSSDQLNYLVKNASSSLASNDVPVGAMILYEDTILSVGYNTVYRDSNAGGHAEINAISNAIHKIGFENFSGLDRKKLFIVSTFEPCMMCKGAILEYNIRNIIFLKGKGLFHWLKEDMKQVRYEWNKSKTDGSELQDSLFRMHPKYGK